MQKCTTVFIECGMAAAFPKFEYCAVIMRKRFSNPASTPRSRIHTRCSSRGWDEVRQGAMCSLRACRLFSRLFQAWSHRQVLKSILLLASASTVHKAVSNGLMRIKQFRLQSSPFAQSVEHWTLERTLRSLETIEKSEWGSNNFDDISRAKIVVSTSKSPFYSSVFNVQT